MPAGLDGNPDPVVTPDREVVLDVVVEAIGAHAKPRVLVGVDGAPATGKSTFADELAARVRPLGGQVVRSTTDSFHRPREERYRQGPASAVGYYLDSHDLAAITGGLLQPFTGGAARVKVAAFDERSNTPQEAFADVTGDRAVLIFDGLFLLRPELAKHWHLAVHLLAEARRKEAWRSYLYDDLPHTEPARQEEIDARRQRARWPRYPAGWQLYLDRVQPLAAATFVIDNDDFAHPVFIRPT